MDGVKNYCSDARKQGEDIVFLRKIRKGAADGSYGVRVAALAGIPKAVTLRAEEIQEKLEQESVTGQGGAGSGRSRSRARKESVYDGGDPDLIAFTANTVMQDEIIDALKNLNVQDMTPIEAMNELYKLQQKANKRT